MGTRSLTNIFKDGDVITTIYRQFDGYPTGHGQDLKDFLNGMSVVNGFTSEMKSGTHANGMGCLAAQLIAKLKGESGLGSIYLYKPGSKDVWEEYTYNITLVDSAIHLQLISYGGKTLFSGPISEFYPEKVEEAEQQFED